MGDSHGRKALSKTMRHHQSWKRCFAFEIADTTVTNREFKAFVDATGYTNNSRNDRRFVCVSPIRWTRKRAEYGHVSGSPWWLLVPGACWNHPTGPSLPLTMWWTIPVVHVSLQDALAYGDWAKVKLPTETQWEYAARGGTTTQFPWGDELEQDGEFHANTW